MNRKLWAREAKREKLDQDIQFILARRRLEEALLADLQMRKLSTSVTPPSDDEVDRSLRKYPAAFKSRTIFSVDQINVRSDGQVGLTGRLSKATFLGEVEAILTREGLVSQRSTTQWNSMFMPASLADKLNKLPADRLFFHRDGDMLIAANVIAKTLVALSQSDRRILARQALMQQKVNSVVAARLRELQAIANVRLQPGFTLAGPR